MDAADNRYLSLWQRMRAVVDAYTAAGRVAEADYCIADFFITFDDADELERHVAIAEAVAREQQVVI